MKITDIEVIPVALPYDHDGPPTGFGGTVWTSLRYLLIRVQTEEGLTGWGEAFGYNVIPATISALTHVVKPLVVNKSFDDPTVFTDNLKRVLHIFGRSGPIQYALSGLDIALWDLKGKQMGCSIASLLSDKRRDYVPAYKSLMKLHDPSLVSYACNKARKQGYKGVKLHEKTVETVSAARQALGSSLDLMLDVNCQWSFEEALEISNELSQFNLKWLEEPIWPPEDINSLIKLNANTGINIAVGENIANYPSFEPFLDSDGISYYQPSVTKVGGISEVKLIAEAAGNKNRKLAPHSPYFGPGLLATLQLAAAYKHIDCVEVFGVELRESLYGNSILPAENGNITIPNGPGLGFDPDIDTINRCLDN